MKYKPIPFEDILTILVSIFYVSCDERKGEDSALKLLTVGLWT